jgi:hypothetical protein
LNQRVRPKWPADGRLREIREAGLRAGTPDPDFAALNPGYLDYLDLGLLGLGAHYAISRAAAFMSCLTSTQVPSGAPQFLHDKTVSLVGASGRSSRPPHLAHLKLLSKVVLLAEVEVPLERLLRIAGYT